MLVTSLAEVWIEMLIRSLIRVASASLPLRKCGLKYGAAVNGYDAGSHFPCGSVDWNLQWKPVNSCNKRSLPLRKCGLKSFVSTYAITAHGHFPCGSVDWNRGANVQMQYNGVTSLAEVWIEIIRRCRNITDWIVTSLAEVWIEILIRQVCMTILTSLPLRKCGLKYLCYLLKLSYWTSLPLRKCGLKFGNYHLW